MSMIITVSGLPGILFTEKGKIIEHFLDGKEIEDVLEEVILMISRLIFLHL